MVKLHCSKQNNKQSKNFDDRSHGRGDFSSGKFNATLDCYCLQCFDTVGWWQEGHPAVIPACKKYGGMVEVGTG